MVLNSNFEKAKEILKSQYDEDLGIRKLILDSDDYNNYYVSKRLKILENPEDYSEETINKIVNRVLSNDEYLKESFYNNFEQMIISQGLVYGVDSDKLEKILQNIEVLTPQELKRIYDKNTTIQEVVYKYTPFDNEYFINEKEVNELYDDLLNVLENSEIYL